MGKGRGPAACPPAGSILAHGAQWSGLCQPDKAVVPTHLGVAVKCLGRG